VEAQDKEPVVKVRSKSKRKKHIFKGLAVVVAASFLFGAGLAIGRGNLTVAGLSHTTSTHNADLSYKLNYSSVEQVYSLLRQDYDGKLDPNKLLDGIKSGLASATGDPYTQYFSAKDAKEFNDALSGSFTGIGAELGTDDDKNVVIVSPLSGYPAEAAGLKPKDIIGAINGQSTSGMSVDAVVKKIRGPENTKVKLTVVRGNQTPFDVEITRTKISVPSVKSEIIGNVGYLKINQFGPDTVDLATKAAQNFKGKDVKGVVVDLRGDPGGYLSAAVDVSSLWLDKGQTVVSERRGGQVINTHYATGNNILKGIPTVVLINGGSASASEITAGALHDNNAAKLVGEKSFGKGSVQQVEPLSGGSEIKITIARWFTPGGKNIDKQGITPDTIVKISDADIKAGKDPQKDQALILVKSSN
jgi:carboxyl-terminal processing protease